MFEGDAAGYYHLYNIDRYNITPHYHLSTIIDLCINLIWYSRNRNQFIVTNLKFGRDQFVISNAFIGQNMYNL